MLVVSLGGVNFGFWSHLGCSGQNEFTVKSEKKNIDLAGPKSEALVNNTYKQLISEKQICTCSKLFCLSLAVVLHDYNAVLYD